MATTVDVGIIDAAAGRTGNSPISSLTQGSIVANVASSNYADSVKTELSIYPWKRASKIASLNRIDPDVHRKPPEPWTAADQLPTDPMDSIKPAAVAMGSGSEAGTTRWLDHAMPRPSQPSAAPIHRSRRRRSGSGC
jgi:hypothetical protein